MEKITAVSIDHLEASKACFNFGVELQTKFAEELQSALESIPSVIFVAIVGREATIYFERSEWSMDMRAEIEFWIVAEILGVRRRQSESLN